MEKQPFFAQPATLTGPDADSPRVPVRDRIVMAQRNDTWGLFVGGILVRPLTAAEIAEAEAAVTAGTVIAA